MEDDKMEAHDSDGQTEDEAGSEPEVPRRFSYPMHEYRAPWRTSSHDLKASFAWHTLLEEKELFSAPVSSFKHAPLSECWNEISVGTKVEVKTSETENTFWVASVMRISGYLAQLRFEGFGQDASRDFWINLASDQLHPIGWCATKGNSLVPPTAIYSKYPDWKQFLVKRMRGTCTIPINFYTMLLNSLKSNFRPGMKLEVLDKTRICQVRVATIKEVTGRRLSLKYDDFDQSDPGFWCHEESPLIHPVGWAKRVGHQIVASQEYFDRCASDDFDDNYCTADMFPEYRQPPGTFVAGMKIEAIDPLNLAHVCVATIMKVLRLGYIMIRIDGYEHDETGSDWFCYHASSPLIFPAGFCERNNIKLKAPSSKWEDNFSWFEYLKESRSIAAGVNLFLPNEEAKHSFKVGMKVESADLMDPSLICVSTITRVVGRLLKIHFDGWEDMYDQWVDCDSVDFYPVGWAELVGHKLETPKPPAQKREKKKHSKGKRNSSVSSSGSRKANRTTSTSTPSVGTVAPLVKAEPTAEPKSKECKYIPRLIEPIEHSTTASEASEENVEPRRLDPAKWTVEDVKIFLQTNDCEQLVDNFVENGIDGSRFVKLSKDDILKIVGQKLGPCLKGFNLLQLLHARLQDEENKSLSSE